jgi:hypothetical protein
VVIDTTTKTTKTKPFGVIDASNNGKFILSFIWGTGTQFLDSATYAHIGPNRILCYPFDPLSDDCLLVNGALNHLWGPSLQAYYVHVLVGKVAMKNKPEVYEEATRCFKSAQILSPFGRVPRLDTIFLVSFRTVGAFFTRNHSCCKVFGWQYKNLWLEIHQHICEALLASRHIKEVGDFLKTMVHDFETLFDNEVAGWLSNKYTVQRDDDSSRAFVTMLSKIQLSVDPTTLGRYLVY